MVKGKLVAMQVCNCDGVKARAQRKAHQMSPTKWKQEEETYSNSKRLELGLGWEVKTGRERLKIKKKNQ